MSATCSCGKKIIWGTDPGGKRIPLDPAPAVYLVSTEGGVTRCVRQPNSMVNHFSTCPDANRHNRSRSK